MLAAYQRFALKEPSKNGGRLFMSTAFIRFARAYKGYAGSFYLVVDSVILQLHSLRTFRCV